MRRIRSRSNLPIAYRTNKGLCGALSPSLRHRFKVSNVWISVSLLIFHALLFERICNKLHTPTNQKRLAWCVEIGRSLLKSNLKFTELNLFNLGTENRANLRQVALNPTTGAE